MKYIVKYYMCGGTLVSKCFNSFSKAIEFSIYKTPLQSVYSIDKVKE
jgi:predicted Fe-Mo cluster-binding NifX family protein